MLNISDENLIKLYLKGDEEAFQELVRRYLPLVYGYVRKYVGDADNASDIAQDTFIKLWRNAKRYDNKRNLKAWIFTIAKNTALDWLKDKKALPFSMLNSQEEERDFLENIVDQSQSVFDQVANKLTGKQLALALEQLPLRYGSVIMLRNQHELTFKEIAGRLKEPVNTVKSRYRRGMAIFRKLLKNSKF